MTELLGRLLPVFIMILIGVIARKTGLIEDQVIGSIKNIIIKIALPGVLFTAFAKATLTPESLILVVLVIVLCGLLYGIGQLLHVYFPKAFPYQLTGPYFTGFEFGMIGAGLFTALWGIEKLPVVMLIAFGHEVFIWFFYIPRLTNMYLEKVSFRQNLLQMIKTPTIIGITLGIIVNLTHSYEIIGQNLAGSTLYATIDFLSPLIAPLILIVVGYSMTFHKLAIKKALRYLGLRILLVVVLGVMLMKLSVKIIPNIDPFFEQAFLAFLLLPPSFIVPLFIEEQEEKEFFSQLLVYYTVLSFVGYVALMFIYG